MRNYRWEIQKACEGTTWVQVSGKGREGKGRTVIDRGSQEKRRELMGSVASEEEKKGLLQGRCRVFSELGEGDGLRR